MNHNRYEDRLTLLNRNKYLKLMNLDDKSFVFNTYEYYKMYKKFTKDQYDKVKTLYNKLSSIIIKEMKQFFVKFQLKWEFTPCFKPKVGILCHF